MGCICSKQKSNKKKNRIVGGTGNPKPQNSVGKLFKSSNAKSGKSKHTNSVKPYPDSYEIDKN